MVIWFKQLFMYNQPWQSIHILNSWSLMQRAYAQVAAEFAMEQYSANNKMGASFILSDLNEYARRCNKIPNSFEE